MKDQKQLFLSSTLTSILSKTNPNKLLPKYSPMNKEPEASSSSQLYAKTVPFKELLKECERIREQVESTKNAKTLIAHSRAICDAFDSIEAMINKFNAMFPIREADEIKAWEYCVDKACEISKEARTKFMNSILTSSSASNTGGLKKVTTWKKQCDKNIEKIESLVKITFTRDDSTWSVAFVLHGICYGACSILDFLLRMVMLEKFVNAGNLKVEAEGFFERAERGFRELILGNAEIMPEGMKHRRGLLEESNKKDFVEEQEEDALEKEKEFREKARGEIMAILQKNLQVHETQKNSLKGEINNKKLHEDEAMKKIEEEEEEAALKNLHEECTLKKLEEEETLKKLQGGDEDALKELQEVDLLKRSQEEIMAILQNNLQGEETQKKIQEDEEARKKLQEDENQKNSQETEVNKRLQEEKALKKSEEEKNSGDKIVEFRFCGITVRMKNGAIEQVLE